ncbi:MAG: glutamine amidotransferase [Wolbachia endosymbiont of Meromenopon meropis]|nr:glutamine amidotransferase [Wolbachia endosymbiont of Meromenopon meropis]
MLYAYYNNIFNIILIIILLFNNITYARAINESLYSTNVDIIVGLLQTEEEIYSHEFDMIQNIYDMFNNFGAKTVLIDYTKIIDLKKIRAKSYDLAKQYEIPSRKPVLNRIKAKIEGFIKQYKINRIFILGSCQNLHSVDFSTARSSNLITEAILEIIDDNPRIHLLSICGGLRNIMNTNGIETISVLNFIKNEEKQKFHSKSITNLQEGSMLLQQIKIVPNSHLAEIVIKFLPPDQNGWFLTYLPYTHSVVVSNTLENRKKLGLFGYRVAAFSSDGIIEIIEDKYGNIYFQSHPEILILKSGENSCQWYNKARQISTLVVISIMNDFLYRT